MAEQAYTLSETGTERRHRTDSALTQSLEMADAMNDFDYQRRILHALGRLHEMHGERGPAEAYYRRGIRVVEKYRESLMASSGR